MKLELGAGDRPTEGFVHNDTRELPDIEIVGDAATINSHSEVGNQSCSEIRATHLLEHFSFRRTNYILRNWYHALKPGGRLYIEVPHIFGHVAALNNGEISPSQFINYVYGDQDHEGNFHYAGFNAAILTENLVAAGFESIGIEDIGMVLCVTAYRPT
jgi:hypothetical protein